MENKFILEGYSLIDQALSAKSEIDEIWITKKSKDSSFWGNLLPKIEKQRKYYLYT